MPEHSKYEMVKVSNLEDCIIRIKRKKGYQHICENVPEGHAKLIVDSVNKAQLYKEREEKLREALEFYADEDNFLAVEPTPINVEDGVITCHYWWIYSTGNPTDTAKQALKENVA